MFENLKREYRTAPTYKKLIFVNVAVFLVLALSNSFNNFFSGTEGIHPFIHEYFFAPASVSKLIFRFWTIVTYMFTHLGLRHIFFNMLLFYIGARVFSQVLGSKKLLNTYILGGLAGLLAFVLAYAFLPYLNESIAGSTLHGASAAVIAVITAITIYTPNYVINLMLLGAFETEISWGDIDPCFISWIGCFSESRRRSISCGRDRLGSSLCLQF